LFRQVFEPHLSAVQEVEAVVRRSSDTLTAALAWHDAGCAVIPIRADGSKAPRGQWKQFQACRPDRDQVVAWFAGHPLGIGVVCGAVSGGLEMLEFEGRAIDAGLDARVADLARACGLTAVWKQLTVDGYCEKTPSGGAHLLYRVAGGPVAHSVRLARRPATAVELAVDPVDRIKVLAETRGEGGYTVVAPSAGKVHPTGRPWLALHGGTPRCIPTISAAERDRLVAVVRCLDSMPSNPSATPFARSRAGAGGVPGADFERRVDWAEILQPAGWTLVYAIGCTRYWRRPGKRTGISATTGRAEGRDRLYVFSTSTMFDAEVPITKFHAYAVLNHNTDHAAAARALRRAGYGSYLM
jgi:putative DNA primase/helicase